MSKSKARKDAETRVNRVELFSEALAEYLAGNMAEMSIRLKMQMPDAARWAAVRSAVPGLVGWLTVEETKNVIRAFVLGG